MDFFYNSICHVCKEYEKEKMKRCGSCKFITYCSKEHQIKDWKRHKQICKVLANSDKFINLDIDCGYTRWRSYRTYLQFYMTQTLDREMLPYENQMWMFPRVCAVCYSKETIKDCESCLCVAYCSEEHEKEHAPAHSVVCSDLKLCLDYDRFHLNRGKLDIKLRDIEIGIKSLPITIQECIETFVDMVGFQNPYEKIFITDIFATMFTILYSLQICNLLKHRESKVSDLVIHVVGADISELSTDWDNNFQCLNNWIENLNSCKFIFIGPDCEPNDLPKHNCGNVKIECVTDFYHNVKNIDDPHLIVALNSGLHEFQSDNTQDTWSESLRLLINNDAPLVLTSYTKQELEQDLKRLESFPKKMLLEIQKNPFSNLQPIRDWDSELYTPFYVNNYIAILAGVWWFGNKNM